MNEQLRLEALPKLMEWRKQDDTVALLVLTVLGHTGEPSLGHLARNQPDVFDDLYEESSGIIRNPT